VTSSIMTKRLKSDTQRRLIAVEAAKLISAQGIRDYYQAKTKAAQQLGISSKTQLPSNTEIEQALREHQNLFSSSHQQKTLKELRSGAVEAMRYFERFQPRLVGSVLDGTADEYSAVCLHLFTESIETFRCFLDESNIPYDEQTRLIKLDRHRSDRFPAFLFQAGNTPIDVTILPTINLRQAPLSPIHGKPMNRANLKSLRQIIDQQESLSLIDRYVNTI